MNQLRWPLSLKPFLGTPASLCSPRLGQRTLTLYIIIICHHLIYFLDWKPVTYAPCSSQSGLLKTQVRSYHYPTSILHWLSLTVTIKSTQLKMIYKTWVTWFCLQLLPLCSFSDYIPVTWAFCGTLRYHHSAFACAVPSTYNAGPCLFTQLDISYFSGHRYNVISPERPPLPDHLLVNANFPRLFSLSIWIFSS